MTPTAKAILSEVDLPAHWGNLPGYGQPADPTQLAFLTADQMAGVKAAARAFEFKHQYLLGAGRLVSTAISCFTADVVRFKQATEFLSQYQVAQRETDIDSDADLVYIVYRLDEAIDKVSDVAIQNQVLAVRLAELTSEVLGYAELVLARLRQFTETRFSESYQ